MKPAWAIGIVAGVFDAMGHDFAVWLPTYDTIGVGPGPDILQPPPRPPRPIGTDLITDPGFEKGLSAWTPLTLGISIESGAHVIANAASLAMNHGIAAARICVNSVAPSLFQLNFPLSFNGLQGLRVDPSLMLHVAGTGYWDSPNGTTIAAIELHVYDELGVYVSTMTGPTWVTETAAKAKGKTITLPSTAAFVLPAVVCDASGIGGVFYIDDVHAYVTMSVAP